MPYPWSNFSVSKPLVFRIRVAGNLDLDMSDYVRGMTITAGGPTKWGSTTTLEGICPDHSALVGILNALGNLGLPIISVECLGTPGDATG